MFYSLEREKDTTPSRDVSTKRENRESAMLETRSRMKRRQEINRAVWISLAMSSVIIQTASFFPFFFFYRKFDGKEISALRILWIFLVSKGLILKEEEEKKNKKKIYTKSMQQFFGLLSVISVIEARNGVACWVEGGQRVLYAKNFISNKRIATSFHARFFSSCNGCDW